MLFATLALLCGIAAPLFAAEGGEKKAKKDPAVTVVSVAADQKSVTVSVPGKKGEAATQETVALADGCTFTKGKEAATIADLTADTKVKITRNEAKAASAIAIIPAKKKKGEAAAGGDAPAGEQPAAGGEQAAEGGAH
jgi:hypothetical protein